MLNNKKFILQQKLLIQHQLGFDVYNCIDIFWIEAQRSYSKIHLISGESKLCSKSLNKLEIDLPEYFFFRSHKSCLVNLYHVIRFEKHDGGRLVLTNEHQVPISLSKKSEIIKLITNFHQL